MQIDHDVAVRARLGRLVDFAGVAGQLEFGPGSSRRHVYRGAGNEGARVKCIPAGATAVKASSQVPSQSPSARHRPDDLIRRSRLEAIRRQRYRRTPHMQRHGVVEFRVTGRVEAPISGHASGTARRATDDQACFNPFDPHDSPTRAGTQPSGACSSTSSPPAATDQMAALERALDSGNTLELARQAQAIKGVAAHLPADALHERADELERSAERGDLENAGAAGRAHVRRNRPLGRSAIELLSQLLAEAARRQVIARIVRLPGSKSAAT